MTLMNPKFPRKRNSKNYHKCQRCNTLYQADNRGTSLYCRPCRALNKNDYESKRYWEGKKQKCLAKTQQ